MSGIWVDTDMGFDDLWALLLLRHLGCPVAGISLVAGNVPLAQVAVNARALREVYALPWPIWQGAARPRKRAQETATRILGPTGLRSRGRIPPPAHGAAPPDGAVGAMAEWLRNTPDPAPQILALGPLTNLAALMDEAADLALDRRARIVWMGGSAGPGNHSPLAEFNALADPEALAIVATSGVQLDIVDLSFCRQVTFGEADLPPSDPLTADLLGGYLDIALERGRPGMAIYDPLAALAVARPDTIGFTPQRLEVSTTPDETYGATRFTPEAAGHIRLSTKAQEELVAICLGALARETEVAHAPRQ